MLLLMVLFGYMYWRVRNSQGPVETLPLTAGCVAMSFLCALTIAIRGDGVWEWALVTIFVAALIWLMKLMFYDWTVFCHWLYYSVENKDTRAHVRYLFRRTEAKTQGGN